MPILVHILNVRSTGWQVNTLNLEVENVPETSKNDKDSAKVTPDAKSDDSPNSDATSDAAAARASTKTDKPAEYGGQQGPEPTRYGDWEKNGRCTDF